jgi:hypothetical protein
MVMETSQEFLLSMRFPFCVNTKQSKPVITVVT